MRPSFSLLDYAEYLWIHPHFVSFTKGAEGKSPIGLRPEAELVIPVLQEFT